MKKIMFNDRYGLTKAVLDGRKTMTRRIVPLRITINGHDVTKAPHKIGEILAIAQTYSELSWDKHFYEKLKGMCRWGLPQHELAGWDNKMFVQADLMPNRIRITNVRVERLQDITEEDCLREGVRKWRDCPDCPEKAKSFPDELYEIAGSWDGFLSPREAFAALIDKVSGKGTWESNPFVFVYEFELVK